MADAPFTLRGGDLNKRVRIERPTPDEAADGAGSGSWELVTEVWAQVQDMLPSRGERIAEGVTVSNRPARVRIRYRTGITPEMRIVHGGRIMQIVAGPAELGRRVALEMVVENYGAAGNPA